MASSKTSPYFTCAPRSFLSPNSLICPHVTLTMLPMCRGCASLPRGHAPHEPGWHKGLMHPHPITKSNY